MWLAELLGISLVAGVVLGVAWRYGEDWWEKRQADKKELTDLIDL